METERKLLKIAGILYGIMGVLTLAFPVYGVFLLIAGIYFFTQANESEEKLYNNKYLITNKDIMSSEKSEKIKDIKPERIITSHRYYFNRFI